MKVKTIVLAGGMSRRMGQDKARLQISDVPLLTHICRVGLAVSDDLYVIAGDDRDYADILPDHPNCIVHCLIDHVLEGPCVALALALQQVIEQPSWYLVLACDLPNLSIEAVTDWVAQLEGLPEDTIAYLPRSEKGWEPLCGFYQTRTIALLPQFVESGGRSFQRWLAQDAIEPFIRELTWGERQVFLNCNTPEDLSRFQA
jgi:molybdenum cofactor guanylyltransferase